MKGWLGRVIILVLLAGIVAWIAANRFGTADEKGSALFKTAKVELGELVVAIAATGTLEPEEVVDVGAQVAGKIQELGHDPQSSKSVDYGTMVEPDTILARIDPSLYQQEVNFSLAQLAKSQAKRNQTRAQIGEANAAVERAEADLVQLKVRQQLSELEMQRANRLIPTKTITQEQFDTAESGLAAARAAYAVGEAAAKQARSAVVTAEATEQEAEADVQSADASLKRAEKNLEYTTIRSPIKGVIIDRRVNIGQTVVSSLNAPSLFLIAKDLSRLQVWASVNEADIGRLVVGQPVTFSVDAFPGETFHGKVQQIRLNASMTQNVVTYTVVVDADNSRRKLLPYLTASLKFEVSRIDNVLLVPNAALRWKPKTEQIAQEFRAIASGKSFLWTRRGDFVRPIPVSVLDTDGTQTAISADGIEDQMEIITGESAREIKSELVNPLLPQTQSKKKS